VVGSSSRCSGRRRRIEEVEDENAKLKKLLAEQMLDAAALRELLSKKW
jgi:putative transposase